MQLILGSLQECNQGVSRRELGYIWRLSGDRVYSQAPFLPHVVGRIHFLMFLKLRIPCCFKASREGLARWAVAALLCKYVHVSIYSPSRGLHSIG